MRAKNTFLTRAQLHVLELRAKGLSQTEVARKLKTSRANVCILERRAKENIKRARETLRLAAKIQAPVTVRIRPDEDIFIASKRLFKAADRAKIKVGMDSPKLIARIREGAEDKLRGRMAINQIELVLTVDGEVLVY